MPKDADKAQKPSLEPALSPGARLWRNRDFNIFWAGQSLSALGDAFAMIALPLLVLQATGSIAQMGLVTATFWLGQIIAGVFSGIMVDRVNRRRLMIFCDGGRALVYIAIPLTWWLSGPQLWLLYPVTLIGAGLGMCFRVAYNTAITNLLDSDQINNANGRLQVSYGVSFIIGPIVAGIICAQFGPPLAIGIDASSFVISALSLGLIRFHQAAAQRSGGQTMLKDWTEGLSFLLHQPVLRTVTILLASSGVIMTAGVDLYIYYLKHDLGQDDNTVGLVFGVSSIGAILSGIFFATLRQKLGFGVCFLGSLILTGVLVATIGFTSNIVIIALLVTVLFIFDTIRGLSSASLRQQITPDQLLGRVTSSFWLMVLIPSAIGAAIFTALAEQIGTATVFIILGGLGLFLGLIGLFTPASMRYPEKIYPKISPTE